MNTRSLKFGQAHHIKNGVCDVCGGHCELLSDNLPAMSEAEVLAELKAIAWREIGQAS